MAAPAPDNSLVLAGELVRAPQLRCSPAGIPIARLWLIHQSTQPEGERRRDVQFRIEVRATGQLLCRELNGLQPGRMLRVKGHLARPDQRGEPARLVVIAEGLELLD